MANKVILSEKTGLFRSWADQFAKADSNHKIVVAGKLPRRASHAAKLKFINRDYAAAAKAAGKGGTVIISLGHGGSSDTDASVGLVDLLPGKALRIQRAQTTYEGSDAQKGYQSAVKRTEHMRPVQCERMLSRYDYNPKTRRSSPPDELAGQYIDCTSVDGGREAARTNELFMRIGQIFSRKKSVKLFFLPVVWVERPRS